MGSGSLSQNLVVNWKWDVKEAAHWFYLNNRVSGDVVPWEKEQGRKKMFWTLLEMSGSQLDLQVRAQGKAVD